MRLACRRRAREQDDKAVGQEHRKSTLLLQGALRWGEFSSLATERARRGTAAENQTASALET